MGQPDSKSRGDVWPPIKPLDSEGNPNMNWLVVEHGEYAEETPGVFGPRPSKIRFPTPYEVWTYKNLQGATWVLYLVTAEAISMSAPIEELPHAGRVFGNIFDMYSEREPGSFPKLRRYKKPPIRLSGPLVVAEVLSYPTGAIF